MGVGGVPGVGKSHLIQSFARCSANGDTALTGSSVIKSVIAPATLREFKDWPEAQQFEARFAAIAELRKMRDESAGSLIVDVHFTLRNAPSALPTCVFNAADRSFYDALVLVEAPSETIVAWRDSDTRRRDVETRNEVEEHLLAERAEFLRQAEMMGVPHLLIREASLDERLKAFGAFLTSVRGAV